MRINLHKLKTDKRDGDTHRKGGICKLTDRTLSS